MSSAPVSLQEEVRLLQEDLRAELGAATGESLESAAAACRAEADVIDRKLRSLDADIQRGARIQTQLDEYAAALRLELTQHLSDVGLTLHRMEGCGQAFFDETLKTRRTLDLLDTKAVRADYESFVLSDNTHELDARVADLVDWLVSSELDEWKRLGGQLENADSPLARTVTDQLEARFDYDRSRLQTVFDRVTEDAMDMFDPSAESASVAEQARTVATNSLFLALAAVVAMGASVAYPDSTVGLMPPLSVAGGLGCAALAVTPYARRRAKRRLRIRVEALREHLERDLRRAAEKEIDVSRAKIWETVEAPLDAIREEHAGLTTKRSELAKLGERAATLQSRLAAENPAQENTL